MTGDIADIGAEFAAMQAAEAGNWQPLADLVMLGRPLSEAARVLVVDKLTGRHKAKRGRKKDPGTDERNKQVYLTFLHLRQSGECPSNDAAYAALLASENRKPGTARDLDTVRKSVEAGRRLFSLLVRREILHDGS